MLKNLLLLLLAFPVQERTAPPPLPPPPSPGQRGGPAIIVQPGGNVVIFPADPSQQPQQQLPPGTATVEGLVTILGTSNPVPGAAVEMRKTECGRTGGETVSTTAGSDGKFSFKQVRAGNWCIGAAKSGGALAPVEYQQRGFKGRGVAVAIADNQQV